MVRHWLRRRLRRDVARDPGAFDGPFGRGLVRCPLWRYYIIEALTRDESFPESRARQRQHLGGHRDGVPACPLLVHRRSDRGRDRLVRRPARCSSPSATVPRRTWPARGASRSDHRRARWAEPLSLSVRWRTRLPAVTFGGETRVPSTVATDPLDCRAAPGGRRLRHGVRLVRVCARRRRSVARSCDGLGVHRRGHRGSLRRRLSRGPSHRDEPLYLARHTPGRRSVLECFFLFLMAGSARSKLSIYGLAAFAFMPIAAGLLVGASGPTLGGHSVQGPCGRRATRPTGQQRTRPRRADEIWRQASGGNRLASVFGNKQRFAAEVGESCAAATRWAASICGPPAVG